MEIDEYNPINIGNIIQPSENGERFVVGSYYWFNTFEDFEIKDYDYLFIYKGDEYNHSKENFMYADAFAITYNQNDSKEQIIQTIIDKCENKELSRYAVVMFLIKEAMQFMGLTFEDVKPYFNRIREVIDKNKYIKHTYDLKILDYMVQNNSFDLTQEQLEDVYQCYKDNYTNKDKIIRNSICFTIDEKGEGHRVTEIS